VKLVILSGPSGGGKSTALRLLCRQSDLQLFEYSNPVRLSSVFIDPNAELGPRPDSENSVDATVSNFSALPQESVMAPILNFIRGLRFDPLSIDAHVDSPSKLRAHVDNSIYMVDDIPYLYSITQRSQLQDALARHIESPHASPLFLIVSDSNTGIHFSIY
jgi:hypothetical protein